MEIDYKVLKQKILNDFDKLMQMEKDCVEAINVANKRVKGNI